MKIFVFFLAFAAALTCFGKHRHKKNVAVAESRALRVWISNVGAFTTSRDEMLANPILITDSAGCKVSGFTISLQAPGHDFYGPLYANGCEFTEVQKESIRKWTYPNSTLYVQDIHLNCHEQDARAPALEYKFDR